MLRKCYFTGKKTTMGGRITHRGISKKAGGIGLQLVKRTKRIFKPNLQKVKLDINGRRKRVLVSTAALRTLMKK